MAKRAPHPPKLPTAKKTAVLREELSFGILNYIGFAIGLFCIVFGFIMLSIGSMTLAPILLVLGYCIIIPVAIVIQDKTKLVKGD